MKVQRYFTKEKQKNCLILNEKDTPHISRVMRMKVGDHVEVVYDQVAYECEIKEIGKQVVTTIKKVLEEKRKKRGNIILLIPLLKEQKLDYILQKSTELGVDQIWFIDTTRSVVKWDHKKANKKLERWSTIVKEASEQSKRLTIPEIRGVYALSDLKNIEGAKMLCSTREPKNNLKLFLQNHSKYDKMFIAVGPEGGFTLQEENTFLEMGFEAVTLGSNILRVETAPLFCLSAVIYENME